MGRLGRGLGLVIALVLLAASACRGDSPPPPPPSLEVALVSSIPEESRWQQAASAGLDRIAGELGAAVVSLRADNPGARRQYIRTQASTAADLVLCFGGGFDPMIYTEAAAFPETRFVLIPGTGHAANVAGVVFQVEGAGYLGGVLAAYLTERSAVGVLHGEGGPWTEGAEAGFLAGFRSVRGGGEPVLADGPDGPWDLVAAGVEVALYVAETADRQILTAANNAGLLLIATDPRAVQTEPDTVVGAIWVDLPEAMVRLARQVRDGSLSGRTYAFDLGSGVVDLQLPTRSRALRDPGIREALAEAHAAVTAGIVELEGLGL